jgi:hypothetical protein
MACPLKRAGHFFICAIDTHRFEEILNEARAQRKFTNYLLL